MAKAHTRRLKSGKVVQVRASFSGSPNRESPVFKRGDYVKVIKSGHTGRIKTIKGDGSIHVRIVTGAHKHQTRRFSPDSLTTEF